MRTRRKYAALGVLGDADAAVRGRIAEKMEEIRARGQEASSNLHFGDGSVTSGVESVHATPLGY